MVVIFLCYHLSQNYLIKPLTLAEREHLRRMSISRKKGKHTVLLTFFKKPTIAEIIILLMVKWKQSGKVDFFRKQSKNTVRQSSRFWVEWWYFFREFFCLIGRVKNSTCTALVIIDFHSTMILYKIWRRKKCRQSNNASIGSTLIILSYPRGAWCSILIFFRVFFSNFA